MIRLARRIIRARVEAVQVAWSWAG